MATQFSDALDAALNTWATGYVGTGAAGPAGPQGEVGPAGPAGPVGATGATGAAASVGLTITTQPSSYTLKATDNGTTIRSTSSTPVTWSLPNNLPPGFNVIILQIGAGAVTFVPQVGAAMASYAGHTKTAGQYCETNVICHVNVTGVSASYLLGGQTA